MLTTQEFKAIHKRFTEALRYLMENEVKLKADPSRWAKIKKNFETKFEKPLDEAWAALSTEDRKKLAPLYLFRKAAANETVQKIMTTFGASISSVEEI
jgi:hypothetical protein